VTATALPDSADVFLVGGQSNAAAAGDREAVPAPPAEVAVQYRHAEGDFVPLADGAVGPGDGVAFAAEYHERTGRAVVLVSRPVGGAAQHPDADRERGAGHWRAGSGQVLNAVEATSGCLDALEAAGVDATLRGVCWNQGESDAIAIDEDYHTLRNYEEAFWGMLALFRRRLEAPALPLFVFQIGRPLSGDTDAWRAVRDAQAGFAAADSHVHLVFEGATSFAADERMVDDLHYDAGAYTEMGREGARGVAAALGAD
jgi:hypothetical protein